MSASTVISRLAQSIELTNYLVLASRYESFSWSVIREILTNQYGSEFEIKVLSGSKVKASQLTDETNTLSLFKKRYALLVKFSQEPTNKQISQFKTLLAKPKLGNPVIFWAPKLNSKNQLLQLANQSNRLIDLNSQSSELSNRWLSEQLSVNKIPIKSLSTKQRKAILDSSDNDLDQISILIRQLSLLYSPEKGLPAEAIELFCGSQSQANPLEVLEIALFSSPSDILKYVEKLSKQGQNFFGLLGLLFRAFWQLQLALNSSGDSRLSKWFYQRYQKNLMQLPYRDFSWHFEQVLNSATKLRALNLGQEAVITDLLLRLNQPMSSTNHPIYF